MCVYINIYVYIYIYMYGSNSVMTFLPRGEIPPDKGPPAGNLEPKNLPGTFEMFVNLRGSKSSRSS